MCEETSPQTVSSAAANSPASVTVPGGSSPPPLAAAPGAHAPGGLPASLMGRGMTLGPSKTPGWCRVQWDHNGSIDEYRMGADDSYDLQVFGNQVSGGRREPGEGSVK